MTESSFSGQNFVFYKPMSIDSKCNETYNKVMLKKVICGKKFECFDKVDESKREISLSQRHARGVSLKTRLLLPVLRW